MKATIKRNGTVCPDKKQGDLEVIDERPTYLGNTYDLEASLSQDLLNSARFYELKFTPVYSYELELSLSLADKLDMLNKVINYLEAKNIHVTFTDRLYDEEKQWERKEGAKWRYLPIAELQGNNICINARNVDFLSILFSIGHIYGHLVQRMNIKKYKHITDFVEMPKPLDLSYVLAEYKRKFGGNYKEDFLAFEIEAFRYAKYTFIEAGIQFTEALDHAMNVYVEADFNELWKWVTSSPQKDGECFMQEFMRLWHLKKDQYAPILPKKIDIRVVPDPTGLLIVVRDEY